jgi:hypothetical protein
MLSIYEVAPHSMNCQPSWCCEQERHFDGVGHGALWVKCQAEGDLDYTPGKAGADMTQLNMLEDSAGVNALIVKRVSPSDRLDFERSCRGVSTLDSRLLINDLDDLRRTEAILIREAFQVDIYAVDWTQADCH